MGGVGQKLHHGATREGVGGVEDGGAVSSTMITAPSMIAAPVVAFAQSNNKTKVGAAPNIGAGSPVSLAAILRKAGSQKLGPK